MATTSIEKEDAIHPGRPVVVDRYNLGARINHWVTAISLILLALSGLAFFHPSLFFLTGLFGGGQEARAFHPWIGVVLFFSFAGLFIRFWRANLPEKSDREWLAHANDVIAGNEEKLPEAGRYNPIQKFNFWAMSLLIIALILTGLAIWDQYFYGWTTIPQKRVAVLVHSLSAVLLICIWIVHVYAVIWARGTLRAMTRGSVTGGWAWRHHRRWLKELAEHHRFKKPAAPAE
ncbi:formate dehydrogenase subunit gamma [Microvirga makkahensis]|uniref:Formate dehydrogenase subunit gamma n=1 Tax=Microvirga makkahensis TaxID=1128670 RepID=A0A7X3MWJ7_9HYPH|nr:formate dehydrogenase subunit gamma [Microvirga makkahensis]MXQ14275.1 formate dehydrogenase subunit gamma [Microvirga makkahensis]